MAPSSPGGLSSKTTLVGVISRLVLEEAIRTELAGLGEKAGTPEGARSHILWPLGPPGALGCGRRGAAWVGVKRMPAEVHREIRRGLHIRFSIESVLETIRGTSRPPWENDARSVDATHAQPRPTWFHLVSSTARRARPTALCASSTSV